MRGEVGFLGSAEWKAEGGERQSWAEGFQTEVAPEPVEKMMFGILLIPFGLVRKRRCFLGILQEYVQIAPRLTCKTCRSLSKARPPSNAKHFSHYQDFKQNQWLSKINKHHGVMN